MYEYVHIHVCAYVRGVNVVCTCVGGGDGCLTVNDIDIHLRLMLLALLSWTPQAVMG